MQRPSGGREYIEEFNSPTEQPYTRGKIALAPKAGIRLPSSCYGHGPTSTWPYRHGEGHTRPCPKPAVHRGIQSLDGNISQCSITQALSSLSVIMIALTWHMLQASRPYQPRLFSPALGVLSTSIRPLSSTSRCYARGRASPSPTDGHSAAPSVQLPPSLSIVKLAMWTGEDARDMLSHVPDLHGIKGYNPSMVDVSGCRVLRASLFPSGSMGPLTFYLLQASVHGRQGCSYQPWISLTLTSPSSRRCRMPVWRLGEPSSWRRRGVLVS
jgi:hypothetical protein